MVHTERRRFLTVASALLAAAPIGLRAQRRPRTFTIGVLFGRGAELRESYRQALAERLAEHGFVEKRNLRIETRTGNLGSGADLTAARELIALKPDALVTCLTSGTLAAKEVAGPTPIVFTWVADPVAAKFVQSYARPGGNITGVTNHFGELLVKRLELARELLPGARRVAVTMDANSPVYPLVAPSLRRAAAKLDVELVKFDVYGGDWGSSIAQAKSAGAAAVITVQQFAATGMRASGEAVVRAALEHRVPVIFAGAEMVEAGGLVSYGTNLVDDIRRAADLLARVLKGADPATIPVDQAARFELVVNLKTAKAIGITIPRSIVLRADREIE